MPEMVLSSLFFSILIQKTEQEVHLKCLSLESDLKQIIFSMNNFLSIFSFMAMLVSSQILTLNARKNCLGIFLIAGFLLSFFNFAPPSC